MTDQNQLDALIARIHEQRATTDRDTIRRELLAAGVPPQLAEQALAQAYGSAPVAAITDNPPVVESVLVDRIRGYLEQHKDTYTQESLRERLIKDGHDAQAVDLAMAQAYGFQISSTPAPPATNRTLFILTIVGVFLANYIIFAYMLTLIISDNSRGIWVPPVLLIGEAIVAAALRRRNRALSRGIAWGIGLTVLPLAMMALLFGICLAVIGSQ